ncbi:hypothetical protein OH77DRAFT_601273 [Trametes cingulata]|nr:hypothetical protein OH77DRAFT_601273 [Trametes cingulata]
MHQTRYSSIWPNLLFLSPPERGGHHVSPPTRRKQLSHRRTPISLARLGLSRTQPSSVLLLVGPRRPLSSLQVSFACRYLAPSPRTSQVSCCIIASAGGARRRRTVYTPWLSSLSLAGAYIHSPASAFSFAFPRIRSRTPTYPCPSHTSTSVATKPRTPPDMLHNLLTVCLSSVALPMHPFRFTIVAPSRRLVTGQPARRTAVLVDRSSRTLCYLLLSSITTKPGSIVTSRSSIVCFSIVRSCMSRQRSSVLVDSRSYCGEHAS